MYNFFSGAILKKLTEGIKQRIFKFIFKRAVGRFIKEIDLSQVDIQLSKGTVELEDLQLNTENINKYLRDVPFQLTSGYIKKIKIQIPWQNILKQGMAIDVDGFELFFDLKKPAKSQSDSVVRGSVLSSFISESFMGERSDPNVLTSSILCGDIRKHEISDFEPADKESSNFLGEGEETIARIIEQVISNIRASVSNVSIKFNFPSREKKGTNNVVILHIPRLDYFDETPMPTPESGSRYPAFFKYKLVFEGFIAQLFNEDMGSSMSFSGAEQEKQLDEGNTILFGDTKNSQIQIRVTAATEASPQSSVEFQFSISSLHAVIKPNHLRLLNDILEMLKVCMSPQAEEFSELRSAFKAKEASVVEKKSPTHQESIIESAFRPVESNWEEDDESQEFHDARSDGELTPPKITTMHVPAISSHSQGYGYRYKRIPEDLLDENPVILQAILHIQSTTISLVYDDTDLKPMWMAFFDKKQERSKGPSIPASHFRIQASDIVLKSQNDQERNFMEIAFGSLEVIERIRQKEQLTPAPTPIVAKPGLSGFLLTDHFGGTKKPEAAVPSSTPTVQAGEISFREIKILGFLLPKSAKPSSKKPETPSPNVSVHVELKRNSDAIDVQCKMDPLQINFNAGIIGRLVKVLDNLASSTPETNVKRAPRPEKNKAPEDAILHDIDQENHSIVTNYSCEIGFIRFAFSFPKVIESVPSETEYLEEQLIVELDNIQVRNVNKKGDTGATWESEIARLVLLLKEKGNSATQVVTLDPTTIVFKLQSDSESAVEYNGYTYEDEESVSYQGGFYKKSTPRREERSSRDYEYEDIYLEKNSEQQLDKTFNNHRSIDQAKTAIIVETTKADVFFTKAQYALLMKLISELSQGIQQSTGGNKNATAPSLQPTAARNAEAIPGTTFSLNVGTLRLNLAEIANTPASHSKYNLVLAFSDFSTLVTMYEDPDSPMKVQVFSEDIAAEQVILSEPQPRTIIRSYRKLAKGFRTNNSVLTVDVSHLQLDKLAKVAVHLQLKNLFLNYYFTVPDENWITGISGFFSSDEPSSALMMIALSVSLQDCAIDYAPVKLTSRMILTLNKLRVSSQMVTGAKEMNVNVEVEGLSGMLHENFKKDLIIYLDRKKFEASEFGFSADLKKIGFVQVASLDNLEVEVRILSDPVNPPKGGKPNLQVNISKGTFLIQTCSDSFQTLKELITYISNSEDIAEKLQQIEAVEKTKKETQSKPVASSYVQPTSPLANITEDYITTKASSSSHKPIYPAVSKLEASKSGAKPKTSSSNDEPPSPIAVKMYKPNFMASAMTDYFGSTPSTAESSKNLGDEYPTAELLISLSQFNVKWSMIGGLDWGPQLEEHQRNKSKYIHCFRSRRDNSKVVEVRLLGISVDYFMFKETASHAWRLLFSVNDFEILDKVKASSRNKMFSCLNSPSNPRDESAKMISIEAEVLRASGFNAAQQLSLDIDVLPLRVNTHQASIMFLQDEFFSWIFKRSDIASEPAKTDTAINASTTTTTSPSPSSHNPAPSGSQEGAPAMTIKSLRLSSILVNIDHEAVKLEYQKLTQGEISGLFSISSIQDARITLPAITVDNTSIEKAIEEISKMYMSKIYSSGIFGFVLGLMPLTPIRNVGSGVYDLFAMPVNQYNKDGRVWLGIQRGISSFFSAVAVETVGIGAQLTGGASNVIGAISGVELQQAAKAVPSSATEGFSHAYASLSQGVSNAMYAVIAIPKQYQKEGAIGAAKAVPVVVMSPLIGVTSAVSKVLTGLQRTINPQLKAEDQEKYKK